MAFFIEEKECMGCGACAFVCLFNVPAPNEDKTCYVIDTEKCKGCGQCENICPNAAIRPTQEHKAIKNIYIDKEKCIGCSLCSRKCPTGAPHGKIKEPFEIDAQKCIKCGVCSTVCRKEAVVAEYI